MYAGFWFTDNDYKLMCPSAAGAIIGSGMQAALACAGRLLLRPYYKGNPTPQAVAQQILDTDLEMVRYPHIDQSTVYYQVGNEPNLPHEGWQGGLPAYIAFFRDVRALLPPRIKLAWAGMSPGVDGWLAWYVAAALEKPDAVVAHVYGQTFEELVNLTITIMRAVPALNIIVGECNFGPGPNIIVDRDAWSEVWDRYLGWVRGQVRILFTLYFAYTWVPDTGISTPVDAKGTKIVQVTLRRSLEDMRMGPAGRSWWVWYVAECGGVPGIIDACKRTDAKSVFIKGGDGPHVWDQANRALVDALTAAGLDVYLWHYTYLGWRAGNVHGDDWKWTTADEIDCVRMMLNQGGPNVKGFISDAEGETEGRPTEASVYAMTVRRLLSNKWFAYAPLPVIDYHQDLPYVQFNQVCDAMLPQFYSKNIGGDPPWTLPRLLEQWDRWMEAWRAGNLRVPTLMPVGETYGAATLESITEFERVAREQEWSGRSYWSLQHALHEGLMPALVITPEPEPAPPAPVPGTGLVALNDGDRLQLQTLFEGIYQAAEHVNAVLAPYGTVGARTGSWAEVGFKAMVSQTKEILGMNAAAAVVEE